VFHSGKLNNLHLGSQKFTKNDHDFGEGGKTANNRSYMDKPKSIEKPRLIFKFFLKQNGLTYS
jgi:hypothetical protein